MTRHLAAFFLLAVILFQFPTATADTIYYNGKIVSLWDSQPICEAVAIRGNRFLAVGSNAEVLKTAGPETKRIDLRGRTVLPGLIDSHTHPISAALSELDTPLPPFNSIADIQDYIRQQTCASWEGPGHPCSQGLRAAIARAPLSHAL